LQEHIDADQLDTTQRSALSSSTNTNAHLINSKFANVPVQWIPMQDVSFNKELFEALEKGQKDLDRKFDFMPA
jgi:hypothetical protein